MGHLEVLKVFMTRKPLEGNVQNSRVQPATLSLQWESQQEEELLRILPPGLLSSAVAWTVCFDYWFCERLEDPIASTFQVRWPWLEADWNHGFLFFSLYFICSFLTVPAVLAVFNNLVCETQAQTALLTRHEQSTPVLADSWVRQ